MLRAVVGFLLSFACTTTSSVAATRGQFSYTLPVVREALALPDGMRTSSPIWKRDLHTEPADDPTRGLLAVSEDVVAFATAGRMCAVRSSNGRLLWCDHRGAAPAFHASEVAYAASDGSVRAVSAQSGVLVWQASHADSVWTAGAGFLVANSSVPGALDQTYREYSRSGRVLWNASVPQSGGRMTIFDGYAFRQVVGDGATLSSYQRVLRLGERGGFVARIDDAWDVLDVRPPRVVYSTKPLEEGEDHFISFDVEVAALATRNVQASYHFEPDYDSNLIILNPDNSAGFHEPIVRVDGDEVFAELLSQKIYRYRLADPTTQKPLLLTADAQLLGGPYRGWLYVAHQDGVWALRPEPSRIRARLVIPSQSTPLHLWAAGDDVYVTLADGRVMGVNATTGRSSFSARPCTSTTQPSGLATTNARVLVVCGARSATVQVFAFQRRH